MDEDDAVSNDRSPRDDVDKKIEALEAQLARVSRKEDKKILWGALGLVVLVILNELLGLDPLVLIVVVPTAVIGGIAIVMYRNIKRKRDVLVSYGLRCSRCGHLPKPFNASGLYYSGKCPKCHTRLSI